MASRPKHVRGILIVVLSAIVVLPFILRGGREPGGLARALLAVQGTGTLLIGLGLATTGAAMLTILGPSLIGQPWLLVALSLYAINLLVAALISRPNLRRLIGIGASDGVTWRRRARQQRYVAYGMAAVIGAIGFLMSTKPQLW